MDAQLGEKRRHRIPVGLQKWLPVALVAVAVLASALAGGQDFFEGDTFWHLETGRWILEHHAVPHSDPFSWTAAGRPWVAHEWLWDVAAYLAWRGMDKWGVWLLALLGVALYGGALWAVLRSFAAPYTAVLITGVILLIIPPFWAARPHVLATGLAAVWLAVLLRGWERPRLLLWLVPLAAIWANIHSSAPLGPGLLLLFLILAVAERKGRESIVAAAAAFGGSALALCLSPQGAGIYTYAARVATEQWMSNTIVEWLTPDFHSLTTMPVLAVLAVAVLLVLLVRRPISPLLAVFFVATLAMGLLQRRHLPLFCFTAAAVIAGELPWEPGREQKPALPLVVVVVAALLASGWPWVVSWSEWPREGLFYPEGALAYMQRHGYTERVFNEYAWGGYLISRGVRPFIDGRADLYILSGTTVYQDYLAAMRGDGRGPERILRNYGVRVVLVPPWCSLRWALEHAPGWKRVYLDGSGVVFVHSQSPGERDGGA